MGHVVRDVVLLDRLLRDAGSKDAVAHGAFAVFLAMLSHLAPLEVLWPDASDDRQAELYFACLALAVDADEERVALATYADQRARGNAIFTAERALARIEKGLRLSVID